MSYSNPPSTVRTVRGFSLSALVALTALAMPGDPAHAGSRDDPPTVTVDYGELNLASDEGVETLYRRLLVATRVVCERFDQRPLARRAKWHQCFEEALSAVVRDVNDPRLSALHASRGGTVNVVESRTARAVPR
jgi:UrcA family protein